MTDKLKHRIAYEIYYFFKACKYGFLVILLPLIYYISVMLLYKYDVLDRDSPLVDSVYNGVDILLAALGFGTFSAFYFVRLWKQLKKLYYWVMKWKEPQ